MSEYTPGPWHVDPEDEFSFVSENQGWGGIGFVHNEPAENKPLMEMARANARLIAAAPELLEVCQKAINVLNGSGIGYLGINADENYVYQQDPINMIEQALFVAILKATRKETNHVN